MRIPVLILLIATAFASTAQAQNSRAWNDPNGKGIRITANFQISTPLGANASAADLTKALTLANQSLYEIINRQCDVIGAALKGDCKIVQLNVNGNINERVQQFGDRVSPLQMVNANANATFLIEPEAAKEAPAAKDAPTTKDAPAQQ
jgi:hypothetical protein